MAHIPVEKKSNVLAWLIPALLLALLIGAGIWMFTRDDDVVDTQETAVVVATDEAPPTDVVAPAVVDTPPPVAQEALTEPITTLALLKDRSPDELVGKKVRIDQLEVTRVVGDKSFYVKPAGSMDGPTVFVFLDEQPTPNTAKEGRYDVNAGDKLTLTGFVQKTSLSDVKEEDDMVTSKELQSLGDDAVYLHADTLTGDTL